MDEIPPGQEEVSGETEPENKGNESDIEISDDYGEDSEVYLNRKYGALSESGEHEGPDNEEPHLKENLPPEERVNKN